MLLCVAPLRFSGCFGCGSSVRTDYTDGFSAAVLFPQIYTDFLTDLHRFYWCSSSVPADSADLSADDADYSVLCTKRLQFLRELKHVL
jgi:hypothetical protein